MARLGSLVSTSCVVLAFTAMLGTLISLNSSVWPWLTAKDNHAGEKMPDDAQQLLLLGKGRQLSQAPAVFEIHGAGGWAHEVNGDYYSQGDVNGKPWYKNTAGAWLMWENEDGNLVGDTFAYFHLGTPEVPKWTVASSLHHRYFLEQTSGTESAFPPTSGWSIRDFAAVGEITLTYKATGCSRPPTYCIHAGAMYDERDCDGDDVPDPYCQDASHSGYIGSSSNCHSTWPNGGCQATTTKATTTKTTTTTTTTTTPSKFTQGNLATSDLASVSCSGVTDGAGSAYDCEKAVDGIAATYWSGAPAAPKTWIEIDLGALSHVLAMQVTFRDDAYSERFKICAGYSSSPKHNCKTVSNGKKGLNEIEYSATGRFLKMTNLKDGLRGNGMSIYEWEIVGYQEFDLAFGKTVVCSGEDDPNNFNCARAVDGSTDTYWIGIPAWPNTWIEIDLGCRTHVFSMLIKFEAEFSRRLNVCAGDSTSPSSHCQEFRHGKQGWHRLRYMGVGRYVKMTNTRGKSQGSGMSITDWQIYGYKEADIAAAGSVNCNGGGCVIDVGVKSLAKSMDVSFGLDDHPHTFDIDICSGDGLPPVSNCQHVQGQGGWNKLDYAGAFRYAIMKNLDQAPNGADISIDQWQIHGFQAGAMKREETLDDKRCVSGQVVFVLRTSQATEDACQAKCFENIECVALSARFGKWCYGCREVFQSRAVGAQAYIRAAVDAQIQATTTTTPSAPAGASAAKGASFAAGGICMFGVFGTLLRVVYKHCQSKKDSKDKIPKEKKALTNSMQSADGVLSIVAVVAHGSTPMSSSNSQPCTPRTAIIGRVGAVDDVRALTKVLGEMEEIANPDNAIVSTEQLQHSTKAVFDIAKSHTSTTSDLDSKGVQSDGFDMELGASY